MLIEKRKEKLLRSGRLPVATTEEGTKRKTAHDVRMINIIVVIAISELLRTSLGPKGMKKLILGQGGDFFITNDGATILEEIEAEHPAAKIMVEATRAQNCVAGDGTITVVVFAGELLKKAERLLNVGVSAAPIMSGFSKASKESIKVLENLAFEVKPDDGDVLRSVAKTSISSKIAAGAREHLASIVVEATKRILKVTDGKAKVDLEEIKMEKQDGGALTDTFLADGVAVHRKITHPDMPKHVENARIALINGALEVKEIKGKDLADVKLQINAPSQMRAYLEKEKGIIRHMVEKIKSSGANVALINKGMDDLVIYYLARTQISAWKRIFTSDMERIARITGGKVVEVDMLTPDTLGHADVVEEMEVGGEKYLLVCARADGKNNQASTIFIRGGTEHVVEEAERALRAALCAVRDSIEDRKAIVGGGAAEIEISKRLKGLARKTRGREQLAIEAFAEAFEIIPKTLAENSGLDVTDIITVLKAKHDKGDKWIGVDALKNGISSMKNLMVFEPLRVKVHAIKCATEAAIMILRIDDVFFAKRTEKEKPPEKHRPEEWSEWEEEPR